jgi:hypothetical protein
MGFFSNLTKSWTKSSQLSELQRKIHPPGQSMSALVTGALNPKAAAAREAAIEEFLSLCESDDGVKQVMQIEGLTRADLKNLYQRLATAGLGQWMKGHYAALSTIAYVEPLQFAVRAPKQGMQWSHVVFGLMEYWEGKVPQGGLLGQLRR